MKSEKTIKNSSLKARIYVIITTTLLMIMLVSFGFFYVLRNQVDRNNIVGGGCINTSFTDGDSINLDPAVPMNNEEGINLKPYHFTLTNSCNMSIQYYVILNVKDNSFSEENIDVSYNGGYPQTLSTMSVNTISNTVDSGYNNSYVINVGSLGTTNVTENIRLWLNEKNDYETLESNEKTSFTAKIKIVAFAETSELNAITKIQNIVAGEPSNTTNVITKTAPDGATCTNTLAYDGTTDNNLRYVGEDPCNYVLVNGESSWRIIGVMNNIDDGTGKLETRLKIIRAYLNNIGSFSWDSSEYSINNGWGVNDWSKADIMKELNSDYLNPTLTSNPYWYSYYDNESNNSFQKTYSLSSETQKLIGNAKWHLGGISPDTPPLVYTKERGTTVWGSEASQTCNDGACPRATQWIGKVGLMYPSDFGFATAGGDSVNRNTCITSLSISNSTSGQTWGNNTDCGINDWLSLGYTGGGSSIFTMAPDASSKEYVYSLTRKGISGVTRAGDRREIAPVVYLRSGVKITGGTGAIYDPYTLSM